MGQKKRITQKKIIYALKTGITGGVITILLLLPASALIFTENIATERSQWIVWSCIILGTILSQIIFRGKQRGRGLILSLVLIEIVYMGFVLVLSAAVPGGRMDWSKIYSIIAVSAIGNTVASLMNLNKLYNHRKAKTKGYTRSNHLKKFT